MDNCYFFVEEEQIIPETTLHLGTMNSTPFVGLGKFGKLTPDFFAYKFEKFGETMAVTDESWRISINIRGTKMAALKKRYKEKLEQAKKLRKKFGDPIALGKSLIEISEDEADQKLSTFKGYKYVSKKF
jgi:hypothetical protein